MRMSCVLLYNSRVNKQSSKLPAVPGLGQSPVSVSPRKQLPLSDTVAGPSGEVTTYTRSTMSIVTFPWGIMLMWVEIRPNCHPRAHVPTCQSFAFDEKYRIITIVLLAAGMVWPSGVAMTRNQCDRVWRRDKKFSAQKSAPGARWVLFSLLEPCPHSMWFIKRFNRVSELTSLLGIAVHEIYMGSECKVQGQ